MAELLEIDMNDDGPTTTVKPQVVVIHDKRIQVDVVDLSSVYGEGQRGMTAKRNFAAGEPIQSEVATVYVTHALPAEEDAAVRNFFLGRPGPGGKMFDVCPPELLKLKGSLIIALTGLLIEKHEKLALIMTTEGPWCLLGRLHTGKYATPYEAFPVAAAVYKFSERWTLQEFGRLYAIVQINAILAYSPLSSRVYGAGLFNGSVFFNHSCIPNAIASVRPGKLVIQALQPIEAGEEVTISYKELPVDVLTTNLVRTLHYDMGLDSTLGCRCQLCMAAEETESTLIVQEGGDPNNDDRVVQMDLSLMWTQGTNQRLSMDEKLLSFVTMMIRDPAGVNGVAGSDTLRQQYSHYFDYEDDKPPGRDYCADLAYVLGELYCTGGTIHFPTQPAENYIFWPRVYTKAISNTSLTLPVSTSQALLARCFGYISAYAFRKTEEERAADLKGFVMNWIGLRMLHGNLFGTTAYLAIVDKSLPIVGEIAYAVREDVSKIELEMKLAAAEEERKEQAARIQRGLEQTAAETGEAPPPPPPPPTTPEEQLQIEDAAMGTGEAPPTTIAEEQLKIEETAVGNEES